MNGVQQALFDLYVLAQFNRLNSIGQDISNNLNILSADKYGAKQSFMLVIKYLEMLELLLRIVIFMLHPLRGVKPCC